MLTIFKTNTTKAGAQLIFESLKKVDQKQLDIQHIVIVPDRASLEAERQLLSTLGGSLNIHVLTFRRFANRILPKYKYLTKQSGIILLNGLIEDNKHKLKCYTKGHDSAGFVDSMYQTISQLKYCKVSPQHLMRENLPKSIAGKLSDIALLYQEYQNFLAQGYIDSADKIELLSSEIETNSSVANSYFYIYDFDNLSAQEFSIVEKLVCHSKGVTVACCHSSDPYDKYLYLNDIYDGLIAMCNKNNFQPKIVEHTEHQNKYTQQIAKYLFGFRTIEPMECDGFVEIFEGATRVQEVYALACKVSQYVRSGGRFRDVYAITSDILKYTNAIETIFAQFEIPYFCDRQFNLCDHQYTQFVCSFVSMLKNNMQLPYVLNFVKNTFFDADSDDVCLFENYCLKYNVNYNYSHLTLGQDEQQLFEGAKRVAQKMTEIVNANLFKNVDSVQNYIANVEQLVSFCKLDDSLEKFAIQQEQSNLTFESKVSAQVKEKFDSALKEIKEISVNRVLTIEDFLKTLVSTFCSVNVSAIPLLNDCVVFANMAKARKHDIKFLALLGANQGEMPIIKSDCKLLNDNNIAQMINCGIDIQPKISIENRRERFSLFQLLQEPSQKIFVSYTDSDGKGGLLPSPFVSQLSQIFCNNGKPLCNADKADENVYAHPQAISKLVLSCRRLLDNQPVKMPDFVVLYEHFKNEVDAFYFNKNYTDIQLNNGSALLLKDSKTSVSKISDFFKCPYMFFLKHGLKIKPRQLANLESNNLGEILHSVLEKFVSTINLKESQQQSVDKACQCFDSIFEDDFLQGLLADWAMKNILKQLKAEAVKMCLVVKEQLQNSKFQSFATELGFGGTHAHKGVAVSFDGGQFELVGVIDRVDVCGQNFIVIDYKSGSLASNYKEKQLYIGQKLQLLVYAKAVMENFNLQPVGYFYFNMHNNFSNQSDQRVYTYGGRLLDDLETALAIDTNLKNGFSERLGLSLTKKGSINKRTNKLLSAEQLNAQIEYALQLIAQAGKKMSQGYIAVNPYEGVCDFCEFSSVCDINDLCTNQPRKEQSTVSAQAILDVVNKSNTQQAVDTNSEE